MSLFAWSAGVLARKATRLNKVAGGDARAPESQA
jgi:hypothetical protein